ncbi:MAG TPA: HIT domain-containing protein [Candidatus Dormibacteraeota bacterium]|nr:HIT domain-containing protein [Candidatus Dormibacteraeota bacterium]
MTAPARACLPGYVCLVARQHVVEPFELAEQGEWWAECMAVARAVKVTLRSPKINYEIHGNTIPHLHLHLYPRFDGDPFAGRPIDGTDLRFERSADALELLRTGIEGRLTT